MSYIWSIVVFNDHLYEWYLGGMLQAAFLDTVWLCLIWLPAYVSITKMIPSDVELVMNAIVATLQFGSLQIFGRLISLALTEILLQFGLADFTVLTIVFGIAILAAFYQMIKCRLLATPLGIM